MCDCSLSKNRFCLARRQLKRMAMLWCAGGRICLVGALFLAVACGRESLESGHPLPQLRLELEAARVRGDSGDMRPNGTQTCGLCRVRRDVAVTAFDTHAIEVVEVLEVRENDCSRWVEKHIGEHGHNWLISGCWFDGEGASMLMQTDPLLQIPDEYWQDLLSKAGRGARNELTDLAAKAPSLDDEHAALVRRLVRESRGE